MSGDARRPGPAVLRWAGRRPLAARQPGGAALAVRLSPKL